MLSGPGCAEILLSSNHQNLSIAGDTGTGTISTPAEAKPSLLTLSPPRTPTAKGSREITLDIRTQAFVVPKTTVPAAFGSRSPSPSNSSTRRKSEEVKNEDLSNFQVWPIPEETEQQTYTEILEPHIEQMQTDLYNHSRGAKNKEKEEALRISHKRYRTLTSILPVGIFNTDLKGRCIYVNPYWQTMTGLQWEEAKNQPWLKLLQPADEAPVLSAWQRCQETGSCQVEFRFFGANHKEYWVLAQLAAEEIDNEIKGYVGSLTNITELKELEQMRIAAIQQTEKHQRELAEAAEKHGKNQEEFIDTLCHELRNLLNGIPGNVGLLQSSTNAIEKMVREASPLELQTTLRKNILHQLEGNQESLAAIDQCARYQKVIVNDVLNFSKLEAGKVELNLIDFDLIKLIRDAAGMLETQANQKQVRLSLSLPPSNIRVKGDPNRLTQVLLNLLSNALKFTPENGDVIVSLSILEKTPTHTVFQFTVKDTGIGMTKAEQNKLFDRFAQATPKISAEYGGSGLGLMISKNLIELMEGKIEVKSNKREGTEFSFTIKLAPALLLEEDESATPPSVGSKKLNSPIGRPLRILIAEDNLINQRMLVKQLQQAGHTCHVANNGQKALELHDQMPFDLILMDMEMPVKDGLEATRAIRQKEQASSCSPIPIVGLSGNARPEYQEEALNTGMNAYLTKPYDKEKLLEMIAHYAPSASTQAVTENLTPASTTFFGSTTSKRRPRRESPSLTAFSLEANEEQSRVLESASAQKKKEPKEIAPFWNTRKLALATATVGAIAIGTAMATKK